MPRLLSLLVLAVLLATSTLPERGGAAPAPFHSSKAFANSVGMKFTLIPAGKFTMGSPKGEVERREDEAQHEVEIGKPFYLGTYEVTQEQYEKVMGTNPSDFRPTGKGSDMVKGMDTRSFPVDTVIWQDAVDFCKKLSDMPAEKRARRLYRLPTEAEWEHACRAGARKYSTFYHGDTLSSLQANFDGGSPYGGAGRGPRLGRTARVGSYKPNPWGLYDMEGNVWEWCQDWWGSNYYATGPKKDPPGPNTGTYKICRGGAWINPSLYCRSAHRGWSSPTNRWNNSGMRALCEVAPRK